MGALLVVLPHHVIREKTLATTRGTKDEFVAVGDDALLHRQIRDIQMNWFSRQTVGHLDAKGRERILIVRLSREEAERRLDEGIETLLRGEVCSIPGNACPIERRRIDGIVPGRTLHQSQS